jgi:hypothetical protein
LLPANANAKHEAAAAAASSTPLQQQKWADFALLLVRAIAFFATCNCGRHAYILVWGIFCTLYGGATAASASMSYLLTARISAICDLQMGVNWWTTF